MDDPAGIVLELTDFEAKLLVAMIEDARDDGPPKDLMDKIVRTVYGEA